MTTLITGGTGFIGAHIARRLLADGERVVTLDNLPSNVIHGVLEPEEITEVTMTVGDVTSLRDVARAIQDHGVDRVVHLASLLHPASNQNPPLAIGVNIGGQATVLEAARAFGLQRVVWASSVVVFGDRSHHAPGPVAEDAPHHPENLYAATKSFDERLTQHYVDEWGVDAIGLRPSVVYGPGRVRGATSFVNELLKPVVGQAAVVPFGDDVVDFQYVEDIAALFATCLTVPRPRSSVFNTNFDVRSIKDAGAFVQTLVPDADITYTPGTFGVAFEAQAPLLAEQIGFVPEFSMERGMRACADFLRQDAGLPPL